MYMVDESSQADNHHFLVVFSKSLVEINTCTLQKFSSQTLPAQITSTHCLHMWHSNVGLKYYQKILLTHVSHTEFLTMLTRHCLHMLLVYGKLINTDR